MRSAIAWLLALGWAAPAAAQEPDAAPVAAPTASAAPPPSETPAPAAAAEPLGLAVGAKLGASLPTSRLDMSFLVGAEVRFRPPVWGRHLAVGVELCRTESGDHGSISAPSLAAVDGEVDYRLRVRLVTVAVEALYLHPLGDLLPYVGLGYDFDLLHAESVVLGDRSTETQWRTGWELRGGAGHPLGPGEAFAELRYHWVRLNFAATGRVNGGAVTVSGGYRLVF